MSELTNIRPIAPRSLEDPPAFRRPETGEVPHAIHVERRQEGGYEAWFALALAGMGEPAQLPAGDRFQAAVLEHLLAMPEEGQRLEFLFRRRPGSSEAPVRFEVCGIAQEDARERALARAVELRQGVETMLQARRDFAFALTDSVPTPAQWVVMAPRFPGVTVPLSRRLGAVAPIPNAYTAVLLPSLSTVESRFPLWRALLSCSFDADVSIVAEPVVLDGRGCQGLAGALATLEAKPASRPPLLELPDHRAFSNREVGILMPRAEEALRRWLAIPRGVRLSLRIASAQPLPSATLQLIARALFPWQRVELTLVGGQAHETEQGALDLRDCLHESGEFPALLPDAEALPELRLPRKYPEPQDTLPVGGLLLGDVGERPVRIDDRDRARHLYVVGATGCGKSTLLLNLIRQDMAAGRAMCVIDPHGDLFLDALASVPRSRVKDVVLVDPGDYEHAVGINFLEAGGPHAHLQRSFITNEMIKIFDRLYDLTKTGGPMFEQYMRNALLLLMENRIQGMTLCEVPLVFEDKDIRRTLLLNCSNESVVRFWKQEAERAGGEASLENMTPYVTSKLNQFTQNALLRPIIGQRSTVDFASVMNGHGILLVNLSKGMLGELDAGLLGMLIIGKLFNAALGRTRMGAAARTPFCLYVDEFQNFTTDTVAALLSEARKFGVQLVLANQHLTQIDTGFGPARLVASVLGNVGTLIAMRLGIEDAERLHGLLRPQLNPQDMQYLPDFHAAVRLLNNGRPMRPFVFRTRKADAVPAADAAAIAERIRWHYRKFVARPVAQVEEEIAQRRRDLLDQES